MLNSFPAPERREVPIGEKTQMEIQRIGVVGLLGRRSGRGFYDYDYDS